MGDLQWCGVVVGVGDFPHGPGKLILSFATHLLARDQDCGGATFSNSISVLSFPHVAVTQPAVSLLTPPQPPTMTNPKSLHLGPRKALRQQRYQPRVGQGYDSIQCLLGHKRIIQRFASAK